MFLTAARLAFAVAGCEVFYVFSPGGAVQQPYVPQHILGPSRRQAALRSAVASYAVDMARKVRLRVRAGRSAWMQMQLKEVATGPPEAAGPRGGWAPASRVHVFCNCDCGAGVQGQGP